MVIELPFQVWWKKLLQLWFCDDVGACGVVVRSSVLSLMSCMTFLSSKICTTPRAATFTKRQLVHKLNLPSNLRVKSEYCIRQSSSVFNVCKVKQMKILKTAVFPFSQQKDMFYPLHDWSVGISDYPHPTKSWKSKPFSSDSKPHSVSPDPPSFWEIRDFV